jgi:glycolate oxidase iron-sulfur subunit
VQPELIADCVHCGFCLPTCPTYELWHEEMDSPRGRIQLMEARLDGTLALNTTVVEHFDRCLGCMACVTSCPSGVRYDRLIEQTREYVEEHYEREPEDALLRSLVFAVFPHPRRLRAALRLAPVGRYGLAYLDLADQVAETVRAMLRGEVEPAAAATAITRAARRASRQVD